MSYISQISELTKEYPWLLGLYSLYGVTVIAYLTKFVPAIWNFIVRQSITTLELNNSGWHGNQEQFHSFMDWYLRSPYAKWSRYLSLDSNIYDDNIIYQEGSEKPKADKTYLVGAGYGTHIFFYKKRLFWFEKSALQSNGTEKEKQSIVIKTLGRNQQPIFELIDDFAIKPKEEDLRIYHFDDGDWDSITTVPKRSLSSVILRKDIKTDIVNNLNYFYNNKKWYNDRGLAYKQTYVLHGVPGTGKSSTIKAIASHFDKNVCVIDITSMSNKTFSKAMSTIPSNSMVIIEDFDSCKSLHSREEEKDPITELGEVLSLSKVLNVLDGVVSLNNVVVFLTTNHLEKIDPALIRKGRVDYIHEIPLLQDTEVKEYIKLMYPDKETPNCKFKEIAGCNIQALYLEHKEDYNSFVSQLDKV